MHIDPGRELLSSRGARFGMAILVLVLLMGLFAPLLAVQDPLLQTPDSFVIPSWAHPLGTNHTGQDIWSQLLYGARTSLVVGVTVALFSTLLAGGIGASAALLGGLYESLVMRIVDAFIVMPMILVLLLISMYIDLRLAGGWLMGVEATFLLLAAGLSFYIIRSTGIWQAVLFIFPLAVLVLFSHELLPSFGGLILVLSLLSWQGSARIIRAQTLSLKEKGHIPAARGFGAGTWYLMRRHILPDLGPLLMADFIFCIRRAVFLQAGLAFLGIGDPATVSWGRMISDSRDWLFMAAWKWWLLPAGIMLSLTIIAITLIGRALEPVLDPRLRREINA